MRTVLAHGHIFKNAGTTLDWSLQRSFGDAFLDHRDDDAMQQRGAAHVRELLADQPGLVAFSTHHLCSPLPQIKGVSLLPIFLLRHPLERIASVYRFERLQEADTPGAQAAKKYDFADYVAWRMRPAVARTIRNYQTMYLAGEFYQVKPGEIRPDVFAKARKAVLLQPLIGVVDRYDEFMVVMEEHLIAQLPGLDLAYVRQNETLDQDEAGQARTMEDKIADVLARLGDIQQQVIDENSYDLKLYELANNRLDEAVAAVEEFPKKLAAFRKRCQRLAKPPWWRKLLSRA